MKPIQLFIFVILIISCKQEQDLKEVDLSQFYNSNTNRVAAEWETAKGVMFACPPVIPKELIIELAKDIQVYPIVDGDEEKTKAIEWFLKWQIDTSKVTFIDLTVDYDIPWVRDWGPAGIFLNSGEFKLVDAEFINSDPFSDRACNDSLELHKSEETGLNYHSKGANESIRPLAKQLGMEILEVPFASTGGNVLTDGSGTAFSTCILLTENRFNGLTDQQFYKLNDSILGYKNYHVISNFEEQGIQHIDCFLKIIDEETLLVAQPPQDHELYDVYEDIVENELSKLRNSYGRPFTIKRIKVGRIIKEYLTAYTNSLILNKNVYVPLYDVAYDSMAMETWKSVMPGYNIKGIPFNLEKQPYLAHSPFEGYKEEGVNIGWAPDDALHCRTRAIWDEDMTFISVNKVPTRQSNKEEAILYATVRDYSSDALLNQEPKTFWRIRGEKSWHSEPMISNGIDHQWYVTIPIQENNTVIEYYVEVNTKAGNSNTRPMTAPNGFFEFHYVSQL